MADFDPHDNGKGSESLRYLRNDCSINRGMKLPFIATCTSAAGGKLVLRLTGKPYDPDIVHQIGRATLPMTIEIVDEENKSAIFKILSNGSIEGLAG